MFNYLSKLEELILVTREDRLTNIDNWKEMMKKKDTGYIFRRVIYKFFKGKFVYYYLRNSKIVHAYKKYYYDTIPIFLRACKNPAFFNSLVNIC